MILETLSTRNPAITPPIGQHENAPGAGLFRPVQIEPTPQIHDRHDAAAQVHHPVDEGGGFRQPGDMLGRARDLADRGNGNAVVLIAQPENDELLVCHGVRFRLQPGSAGPLLVQDTLNKVRPKQPVRRQQRDQSPSAVEPANRGDLRVPLPAGQQSRRRIDNFWIETENLPGRIDDNTDRAFADRYYNDLTALSVLIAEPADPAMCAATPAAGGGPAASPPPTPRFPDEAVPTRDPAAE